MSQHMLIETHMEGNKVYNASRTHLTQILIDALVDNFRNGTGRRAIREYLEHISFLIQGILMAKLSASCHHQRTTITSHGDNRNALNERPTCQLKNNKPYR